MNENKQSLSIPVAIIIAGAMIAAGIYLSGGGKSDAVATNPLAPQTKQVDAPSSADYVLGNRKAPIVIVEYSDIECPYCKMFHETLHSLVDEYDGKLAWAYRHFPVHRNSVKEAEAAECAGELGGNEAFWKYLDRTFELTNSNDSLDLALLPTIATDIGLKKNEFEACLSSGKYAKKITDDQDEAVSAGARGTPYSVLFVNGKAEMTVDAAYPYREMKLIVDTYMKEL